MKNAIMIGVFVLTNVKLDYVVNYLDNYTIQGDKMLSDKINLKEKLSKLTKHWSPRIIAEMNDYQFKIAKIKGEFIWHDHKNTDETFIVIKGTMCIKFRDSIVELSEGEMFVVPKGVEHKPCAENECKILVVEPRGVINTGDARGELTITEDVWV